MSETAVSYPPARPIMRSDPFPEARTFVTGTLDPAEIELALVRSVEIAKPILAERDAANLRTHIYLSAVDCAACGKLVYEWPGKTLQWCPHCGGYLETVRQVRDVAKRAVLDPKTGNIGVERY